MVLAFQSFTPSTTVTEHPQITRGTNFGVKQANRTGRDVASVLVFRFPGRGLALIQTNQLGVGHVDFASNLQDPRRIVRCQFKRYIGNCSNIVRNVIADFAIATSQPAD